MLIGVNMAQQKSLANGMAQLSRRPFLCLIVSVDQSVAALDRSAIFHPASWHQAVSFRHRIRQRTATISTVSMAYNTLITIRHRSSVTAGHVLERVLTPCMKSIGNNGDVWIRIFAHLLEFHLEHAALMFWISQTFAVMRTVRQQQLEVRLRRLLARHGQAFQRRRLRDQLRLARLLASTFHLQQFLHHLVLVPLAGWRLRRFPINAIGRRELHR